AEITVEVNPGTCDAAGFKALKEAGVNRISLGVQSFVDDELRLLGRIHSAKEAEQAVLSIHEAGIVNVSLDFMFAIPAQTEESLLYSLEKAVALSPAHLSCYSLTLSDETPLARAVAKGNICLPDDETDRRFYHTLTGFLEKNGYMRYEISNFAKPSYTARHNTKYWQREPYIGLGLAAHSFFSGMRYENPSSFSDYYARAEHKIKPEGAVISAEDAMSEFIFLGLRQTRAGISRKSFYDAFGQELDVRYGAPIQKLCALGLLTDDGKILRLTERGIDVSNSVFCEFL
ncbi:MAG: radical SAM family heme chaperone HemW, partial [Clostridia bacterium]|nr:radical SAM family heme chaperone HemW [Clostridia bacterium]